MLNSCHMNHVPVVAKQCLSPDATAAFAPAGVPFPSDFRQLNC